MDSTTAAGAAASPEMSATGTPVEIPAEIPAGNSPGISPGISVVVPHLNQPDLLEICLASLAAQTLPADRFEVIVVDNGSERLPEAEVAHYPFARLVLEPEPGPGPARNRGIALARADVIAFLDSDCIADPRWLENFLATFAAHPETGILGGRVMIFAAGPRPNIAEAFDLVYGIRQEVTIARHRFAATANLAVRREVFDKVGLFAGLAVSEDMEWGQRADAAGWPTRLAEGALVRHPARDSMAALRKQWDRHVSHFWSMRPKSAKKTALWIAHAVAIAGSPVAEIPRIAGSDQLSGLRQRLAAFRGVVAMRGYRARRMIEEVFRPEDAARATRWNRS